MRPRSMARTLAGTVKEILGSAQVFYAISNTCFLYLTQVLFHFRALDVLLMEKILTILSKQLMMAQ